MDDLAVLLYLIPLCAVLSAIGLATRAVSDAHPLMPAPTDDRIESSSSDDEDDCEDGEPETAALVTTVVLPVLRDDLRQPTFA